MRAKASFTKPGGIEATITLTATLEKWQELREQLKDAPFYGVARDLNEAVSELTTKLCGWAQYEPPSERGDADND